MALTIKPSKSMRDEIKRLGKLDGQMRFAAALAMTRTAQHVKKALDEEILRVFDRPTPWAQRSLYMQAATKQRQEAKVWIKDGAGWKTTPPERFMRPHIDGGQRNVKRFEAALRRIGVLPAGMVTVPAMAAELDAYGNMRRQQIVKLLSYFRAFGEQGYRANITDKRKASMARGRGGKNARAGEGYFALQRPHGKLKPGIYRRYHFQHGTAVRPVLIFVKSATYRQRYDFFGIGQRVANEHIGREFEKALAHALATAK